MGLRKLTIIVIFCLFFLPVSCFADLQSDLEAEGFDIVYTFDNCQDWIGTWSAIGDIKTQSTMPKYTNGDITHWRWYASYIETRPDNWIGDHGADYNWNGSKSLCINYTIGGNDAPKGYGPSHIAMYFGDSYPGAGDGDPTVGYKKIYIFYMVKFRAGFFIADSGTTYINVGAVKFMDVNTGFGDISQTGTIAENETICGYTTDNNSNSEGYGLNFNIWNITNLSSYTGLGFKDAQSLARFGACGTPPPTNGYSYSSTAPGYQDRWHPPDFESEYRAGNWVGIEYMIDIGTMGNADGSTSISIYKSDGTLIETDLDEDDVKLLSFANHKINKVQFGGNRIKYAGTADPTENRFYIDDFIIDDAPIAAKYFGVLANQSQAGKCNLGSGTTGNLDSGVTVNILP